MSDTNIKAIQTAIPKAHLSLSVTVITKINISCIIIKIQALPGYPAYRPQLISNKLLKTATVTIVRVTISQHDILESYRS